MKKLQSAKELFGILKPVWEESNTRGLQDYLKGFSSGAIADVENKSEVGYYQFLPVLVEYLKPKQVVELGGAMGASALMMLSSLPKTSRLYSVTLAEGGLEFSFVKGNYPNFVPIVGDDLDLKIFPVQMELGQTDLWFFDSEHNYHQLHSEIELYRPFFKKGAVILVDDIKLNPGMWKAWLEFPGDKFDATTWLHYSGFGIVII